MEQETKTELAEQDKQLIRNAFKESKLQEAVTLRLYIQKYNSKTLPLGKLHNSFLKKGSQNQIRRNKSRGSIAGTKENTAFLWVIWTSMRAEPSQANRS